MNYPVTNNFDMFLPRFYDIKIFVRYFQAIITPNHIDSP